MTTDTQSETDECLSRTGFAAPELKNPVPGPAYFHKLGTREPGLYVTRLNCHVNSETLNRIKADIVVE